MWNICTPDEKMSQPLFLDQFGIMQKPNMLNLLFQLYLLQNVDHARRNVKRSGHSPAAGSTLATPGSGIASDRNSGFPVSAYAMRT
jgi:hypothetical protein